MNFTFYYTIGIDEWRPRFLQSDVPLLLPASSYARYRFRRIQIPSHITQKAADSGGFIATFKWGDYRYTPQQYVDWLSSWEPDWAATMDYCCEDEITSGRTGVVRERQQKTTGMAWRFWDDYRTTPWPWVPTVQGWKLQDYARHARDLKPLVTEMQSYYDARDGEQNAFRVGIGTLCRRTKVQEIAAIVMTVAQELPQVKCFHLWGVKKTLWSSGIAFPFDTSSDSASWNMQAYYGDFNPEWKRWKEEQAILGLQESNRSHRYKILIPQTQQEIEQSQRQIKQQYLL